jgi:pilus assembly protein Flp/PilA
LYPDISIFLFLLFFDLPFAFIQEVFIMSFVQKVSSGQGLTEYAIIIMLVAIVVILLLLILGPAVGNLFSNVVTNI